MEPKLSIIIPVLNEEERLPLILKDIENCKKHLEFPLEAIVVDGGSDDRSVEICRRFGTRLIFGPRGRGQQLALGAEKATGNYFLFLHADNRICAEHCQVAISTLQKNDVAAGGFVLKFDDPHPILRLAELINKARFRLTRIFYGDHGIFLRREQYHAAGGFQRQSLFEDIEFSRRLKKMGKVVMTAPPMLTSARRFRAGGVVRTYLKMAAMHILYWMRVSPETLAAWYKKHNRPSK
ncbi:MAG: TIGR04283 family arsenosugar biosynthesis glycosyltransferase [bacterium]